MRSRWWRKGAKWVASTRLVLGCEEILLRGSLALHRVRPAHAGHDVLIATNGRGNLGDQAMLDAFIANTPGTVYVVMSREGDLRVPVATSGRVTPLVISGFFDGSRPLNVRGALQFARVLRGARGLAVVGADIMDGSYGPREAVGRIAALRQAALRGIESRLLGFSWGHEAHPLAERALLGLPPEVRLLVRDPNSLDRLSTLGARNLHDAADTVFSLPAPAPVDEADPRTTERPTVVLNVSGLIAARMDVVDEYESIVRHLTALGACVRLVPHVVRDGDDDLAACREVLRRVPDGHVTLVEDVESVADVQALVRGAALVITGRMHLSILAMNCRVPAVVFSTQGKVEGMLERLGLPHLAVPPGNGMADRVVELVPDLCISREWRASLTAHLHEVRRRSRLNFTRAA